MLPLIPVAGSAFPQGVAEGSGVPLYEVLYDGWASFALTPEKTGGQLFLTLRSRNLAEVEKAGEPQAYSANLLLARTPGVVHNLEVAPLTVRTLGPEDGALVHANPFPEPPMQGGFDREGSLTRQLSRHLSGNCYTLENVQNGSCDRENAPDAVCRRPDHGAPDYERYATVVSAVLNLLGRVLYISDGPPDTAPYTRVALVPMVGRA